MGFMKFSASYFALFMILLLGTACEKKVETKKGELPSKTNSSRESSFSFSGSIRLSPDLVNDLSSNDILYVILTKDSPDRTPPMAVQRISSPSFPLNFELNENHQMIKGVPVEGPFLLKARISKTGDAIPAPGDLQGIARLKLSDTSQSEITVTIDQKLGGS